MPCLDIHKWVNKIIKGIKSKRGKIHKKKKMSKKKIALVIEQERRNNAEISSLKRRKLKQYAIIQTDYLRDCSEVGQHDHMIFMKQAIEKYINQVQPIEGYQKIPNNAKFKSRKITAEGLRI